MTLTASPTSTETYGVDILHQERVGQLRQVITRFMATDIWTKLFVDSDGQPDPMSWGPNFEAKQAAERALAHINNVSELELVMNTFDCRPVVTGRLVMVLISLNLNPPPGLTPHPEAYALSVATIMGRLYALRHGLKLH